MLAEVLDKLPEEIDNELFRNLIEEYKGVKSAYYSQNHELTLTRAGKFVEVVFQLLSNIAFDKTPERPNFNNLFNKLEGIPEKDKHVSIRVIIPRAALTLYTLRSKRGATHINNKASPSFIDCTLAISICDWITSEFLRLYLVEDQSKVLQTINSISKLNIPLIEEIDGELIILNKNMIAKEQILTFLFQKYPDYVQRSELRKWVKNKSLRQINRAISELSNDSFIFEGKNGLKLTTNGINDAEKIQIKYHEGDF